MALRYIPLRIPDSSGGWVIRQRNLIASGVLGFVYSLVRRNTQSAGIRELCDIRDPADAGNGILISIR